MDVLIEKLKDNHRDIDPIDSDQNDDIKTKDNLITDNATIVEKLNDDDDQNTQQEMTEAELKVQEQLQQLQDDHDLWSDPNPFGEEDIMNSTRMNEAESQLDIQLSPVRSLRARLEALKQKAIKELPEPTNLQERYRLRDIRFKLNHQVSDERDESSVGRLREKYVLFSQLQREEEAKKNRNLTTQLDPVDKSTCKLITLKKTLKVKMVEKRRQEYEKRLKLYKMENENELEEEEVDGENDDDNDANSLEEEEKEYEENGEDFGSQDDKLHDDVTLKEKPNKMNDLFEDIEVNKNDDDETGDVDIQSLCGANVRFNESCPLPISSYLNQNPDDKLEELMDDCKSQMTTSQDIMDLCSGKMKKSLALLVESEDEENDADDDNEKMSQENVIRRQRYNFDDSDDEMNDFALELNQKLKRKQNLIEDDEESADGLKRSREDGDQEDDSQESTGQVRRMNELDEEANQDDEERDEEYGNGEFVKKSRWRLNDFIEDQAELSEEDADAVSSDEDEGGENEYEQEEINEDLPSDEEILAQNNKIFWKQQMDEDKRELLEYQERFLENGDLEADKETRKRKFKWKHVESTWINNVMDSDDNDDENAQDETFEYKPLQLKQLTSLLGETHQDGTSSNGRTADRDEPKAGTSQGSNPASSQADTSLANGSFFSKHIRTIRREMVSGPSGDIQSYIIKDKNLVKAMSLKRPNETGMKDANKRARTDARTKTKSIFDVFQF